MDNQNSNKNNHNLEATGNTLGQAFETGRYNENFKSRKGMIIYIIIAILALAAAIYILTNRNFPPVQIIYAGNEQIEIHEIRTNTFGKTRLADSQIVQYTGEGERYDGMEGRIAQLANLIKSQKIEMIISDADTLRTLAEINYLNEITYYMEKKYHNNLLVRDTYNVGNITELKYGVPVNENRYFPLIPEDGYIGIVSGVIIRQREDYKYIVVSDIIVKMIEDEPYSVGWRKFSDKAVD